jgi:hypothetical protein
MKGLPKSFRNKVGRGTISIPWTQNRLITRLYFDTALKSYRDRRNIRELEDEPSVRWAPTAREPERPIVPTQPSSAYPTTAPAAGSLQGSVRTRWRSHVRIEYQNGLADITWEKKKTSPREEIKFLEITSQPLVPRTNGHVHSNRRPQLYQI